MSFPLMSWTVAIPMELFIKIGYEHRKNCCCTFRPMDMFRRAMGKSLEMERKEIFRKGKIENGFDEQKAADLLI